MGTSLNWESTRGSATICLDGGSRPPVSTITGVYGIFHTASGRAYVGCSRNVRYRIETHIAELRKGAHVNYLLQNAWNKYGESAFDVGLLARCATEELMRVEQRYVDLHGAFNVRKLVDPTNSPSDQTRQRMRESKRRVDKSGSRRPLTHEQQLRRADTMRRIRQSPLRVERLLSVCRSTAYREQMSAILRAKGIRPPIRRGRECNAKS